MHPPESTPLEWTQYINALATPLHEVSFRDKGGDMDPAIGFERWTELAIQVREQARTIYLIGNGASAAMASHMAADLAKNARLHTQVFTDPSMITAISNDISYEEVFAEPLRRRATEGDMLVAISSSGSSPNILAAVREADTLGVCVVTLSSMNPGNPLRQMGTINVHVACPTYGLAESAHATILHFWMDLITASDSTASSLD